MNFRTAILQRKSCAGAYSENANIVVLMMREAAKNNADILLLPEAFLTGCALPTDNNSALCQRAPMKIWSALQWQTQTAKRGLLKPY
ncbi:MAG: nitrilase-related carbon-nitrogen hydrolase [Oscillospiraceae bacterium]|nr:nitrilase-related carbon-nitrogen hydrolase [Oscillospiraceae bacterium]